MSARKPVQPVGKFAPSLERDVAVERHGADELLPRDCNPRLGDAEALVHLHEIREVVVEDPVGCPSPGTARDLARKAMRSR